MKYNKIIVRQPFKFLSFIFNEYYRDKELFQSRKPEWIQKVHNYTPFSQLKVKYFLDLLTVNNLSSLLIQEKTFLPTVAILRDDTNTVVYRLYSKLNGRLEGP